LNVGMMTLTRGKLPSLSGASCRGDTRRRQGDGRGHARRQNPCGIGGRSLIDRHPYEQALSPPPPPGKGASAGGLRASKLEPGPAPPPPGLHSGAAGTCGRFPGVCIFRVSCGRLWARLCGSEIARRVQGR
jgi:hypothetical protein